MRMVRQKDGKRREVEKKEGRKADGTHTQRETKKGRQDGRKDRTLSDRLLKGRHGWNTQPLEGRANQS